MEFTGNNSSTEVTKNEQVSRCRQVETGSGLNVCLTDPNSEAVTSAAPDSLNKCVSLVSY